MTEKNSENSEISQNVSPSLDTIVSFCKRRGFVFQASLIYGGLNGFFDYGPLGVEMCRNIRSVWWHDMVQMRDDMVGIDSSIIQNPKVWQTSGHVDGFSDPMVDCKVSKMRFRADQLLFARVILSEKDENIISSKTADLESNQISQENENSENFADSSNSGNSSGEIIGYVCVIESENAEKEATKQAQKILSYYNSKHGKKGTIRALELVSYTEAKPEEYDKIPSPATGLPGSLTPPRQFNLMFHTFVGALQEDASKAYLRPETAQGIFTNFSNVLDSSRMKIPFGIAQIGKAFRNEITPRNFVFRSREFEQMEIEYFISPDENSWFQCHQEWIQTRLNWHKSIGLPSSSLSLQVHPKDKLAHYSKACTDIVFDFPFGTQELEGIAARGDFDLTRHQTESGKSLEYFDENTKTKYVPHVIEPSVGVDRLFLALICSAYFEEEVEGEKRIVLRLNPRIAPVKVGIFPLVKNKPEIVEKAKGLYDRLKRKWNVFFDTSGAIGRRYRRMDEIGTPFGITVDFESLENNTVTIRERDSMKQIRIHESEIMSFIEEKIVG